MIGQWDNSKCIIAALPICLKRGTNPAPYGTGIFPMYTGPIGPINITGVLNTANPFPEGDIGYNRGIFEFYKGATAHRGYLLTDYDLKYDLTTNWTVNTWCKISEENNTSVIALFGRAATSTLKTLITHYVGGETGIPAINISTGPTTNYIWFGNSQAPVIGTHMYTFTKNGPNFNFYADAQEIPGYPGWSPPLSGTITTELGFTVGVKYGGNPGIIHCSVYSGVLSGEEIATLYSLGPTLRGLTLTPSGTLLEYFPTPITWFLDQKEKQQTDW